MNKKIILFTAILFAAVCACAQQPCGAVDAIKFITVEVSDNLRLMMPPDIEAKYKAGGAANFIKRVSRNIETVLQIKINYPEKPVFTFMVLHRGEEFHNISGSPFENGIAGVACRNKVLAIDDVGFFNHKGGTNDIGLIHELAHIMHDYFFTGLGRISEGFAEVIPFYILGLEDETQKEIIRNMKEDDFYTVVSLGKKGAMFQDKNENRRAQHRKTYISMYLWMRGYLQELEKQRNIDKIEALNLVLAEFKKAESMATWKEKDNHIAALIGLKPDVVFNSVKLQLEAQKDFLQ